MSFWGATVITNLFSAILLVGKAVTTWLWGGFAVGQPTLNRFYSLHYLLLFMIAGVVVLHTWRCTSPGRPTPPVLKSNRSRMSCRSPRTRR